MPVKPIPEGYRTVTPYLVVKGAAAAIEFYKKAFRAVETMRMSQPDGKIGHAELRIGDSPVMVADEIPETGYRGPASLGGSPVGVLIYVEDVDVRFAQAIAAGAKEIRFTYSSFGDPLAGRSSAHRPGGPFRIACGIIQAR